MGWCITRHVEAVNSHGSDAVKSQSVSFGDQFSKVLPTQFVVIWTLGFNLQKKNIKKKTNMISWVLPCGGRLPADVPHSCQEWTEWYVDTPGREDSSLNISSKHYTRQEACWPTELRCPSKLFGQNSIGKHLK